MTPSLRIVGLLLIAGILHASPFQLAVVVRAKGDVSIGSETAMHPASAGTLVVDGSRLKTGGDGRALVRFLADQSITEIKPNTVVDFSTRAQPNGKGVARRILLRAGEAAFGITPGKGRDMRFETATTVASVRGTNFDMAALEGDRTFVHVDKGVVHICNPITGEEMDLHPGQGIQSGWNGLSSDTTRTSSDSAAIADSLHASRLEVDFVHPVTGATRTLVIRTQETR